MVKFVFKWIFRLALLAVVLAVVFLLSLDTLLRVVAENRIRAQTGMAAEIGRFHLGLTEPVVSIQNLKLYNPPEFGGTPFLNLPEIHVEYDRAALRQQKIHLTLVRFSLAELVIVKNAEGKTNILALGVSVPDKKNSGAAMAGFKQRSGFEFPRIDVLNVSVGTFKFMDLKDPRNNREQNIGITNLVMTRTETRPYAVQEPADFAGLATLVALRSGDFFKSLAGPGAGLR